MTYYEKKYLVFFVIFFVGLFYKISINNLCYADNYTISYELDSQRFTKKIPKVIIEKYQQNLQNIDPDINNLFNEPINILILYELLQNVIAILDEYKIDYWLSEETLLNYNKFSNFAPWQQDIQLSIDYNKFKKYLNKIVAANCDIVFTCYDNISILPAVP